MAWNLVLDCLAQTAVEPRGVLGDPDIELALEHVGVLSQVAACNAGSRRKLKSVLLDWREALRRMTSSRIDRQLSFLQEHPLRGRLRAAVERIRLLCADGVARRVVQDATGDMRRDPSNLLMFEVQLWVLETDLNAMASGDRLIELP